MHEFSGFLCNLLFESSNLISFVLRPELTGSLNRSGVYVLRILFRYPGIGDGEY